MAYDNNNIFARILRGELPKVAVYEDDLTLAFMDIMPSVEGHTLVITKELAEGILDLSTDGAVALIKTTQKVARAVKKGSRCAWHHAGATERRGGGTKHSAYPFSYLAACRRPRSQTPWPGNGKA